MALALTPLARRLLVGVLLLALALHGVSSAVLQMLGPAHHHLNAAPRSAPPAPGWAQALAARVDSVAKVARAFRADMHARSHAAAHSHAGLGRHHHRADDASVVVIDAGAGDGVADGGGTVSPLVTLALAMATAALPPAQGKVACRWPPSSAARWADALIALPERPPQA